MRKSCILLSLISIVLVSCTTVKMETADLEKMLDKDFVELSSDTIVFDEKEKMKVYDNNQNIVVQYEKYKNSDQKNDSIFIYNNDNKKIFTLVPTKTNNSYELHIKDVDGNKDILNSEVQVKTLYYKIIIDSNQKIFPYEFKADIDTTIFGDDSLTYEIFKDNNLVCLATSVKKVDELKNIYKFYSNNHFYQKDKEKVAALYLSMEMINDLQSDSFKSNTSNYNGGSINPRDSIYGPNPD